MIGQTISHYRVRPTFLLGSAAVVVVLILPGAVAHSYNLKRALLFTAAMAILAGFLLLLKTWGPQTTWRELVALITAVYLLASLPVSFFELSQVRWFMAHPWHAQLSMYALPWVRWGYILIPVGVIGSFVGRGWARIALVTGSVFLFVLWLPNTWVY